MDLSPDKIVKVIDEIEGIAERDRRAKAKRRLDIYRDGGKHFLVENILREFGRDALAEFRVVPINLLKKIVDKRAGIYKRPPTRLAGDPKDQALVDYYVEEMSFNEVMAKANRYLVLSSNTALYIRPHCGELTASVVPNYQYSIIADPQDNTEPEFFIFSSYVHEGRVAPDTAPAPATGFQTFSEENQAKFSQDLVESQEYSTEQRAARYIFWSDGSHFTTDSNGNKYAMPDQGEEQFLNPIQDIPVVNIARDRDNETWATQGEDMIDLTMAIQMAWSDVMTIAKHTGFSILTITSEEEPKKLQIGVNRAVWLKLSPNGPQPSISYVHGQSPLQEYKELITELLKLLLTTNNMEPGAIGGNATNYTSGFHALIAMADSLEAIESDKPIMLNAEKEAWEIIRSWHNWMIDNGTAPDDAKALGKFTDNFSLSVQFADVRPLESEDERIARVKMLMDMGLITRLDALKKLHNDLTDEQATAKLEAIDNESMSRMGKAMNMVPATAQEMPAEMPMEGDNYAS